ncbi:retron Ec48 family effector membrane protein [Cedecea neteri]|uniref:retron Ec48 family effector membrane protein n=1 Tax=Cedecea neteri TaxID=158822 RepID=UPI00289BEE36|nr:retron Ec48 family effector membrane protein [Cedecea neteri]
MSNIDKLQNDYHKMCRSFDFLNKNIGNVLSCLKKTFLMSTKFFSAKNEFQEAAVLSKKSFVKAKMRFGFFLLRGKITFISLITFLIGIPLSLIKGFFVGVGRLFDLIPLGDFGRDKEIRRLILTIFTVLMIGVFSSLVILIFTIYRENLYQKNFCFTDKCVVSFFGHFNSISIILQSVAWLITLITTTGGIGIALMTYKTGVKNSNLTNHISHLNMFRDYVNAEISKRKFISPDKVNIYRWYSLIFPYSKRGDVSVSLQYRDKIVMIVDVIESANDEIQDPAGRYLYMHHQVSMLNAIGLLGLKMSTGPKNEFVLIEKQVFELIDCINLTFTDINIELSGVKRLYA